MRLLDSSDARVRMLIAPAGYGKTTLAEQWTSAEGRQAAWYQCRASSADVASLSVGLAKAASAVIPDCGRQLHERLLVTKDPSREVDVLADLLARDFTDWPAGAWLVVDDYQFVRASREAELFVEALIQGSAIQVMITSRSWPIWSVRQLGQRGDVFAIGTRSLAMNSGEANEVLKSGRSPGTTHLPDLAQGWPALIALASVTQDVASAAEPSRHYVAEALYDIYAAEIFRRLERRTQVDVGALVVAPTLDRALAQELLGANRAESVIREATEAGILDSHSGVLDFHPLARAFLETRHSDGSEDHAAFETCFRIYKERRDWDSAFELIDKRGGADDFDRLLSDALDPLLEMARLTTLDAWIQRGEQRQVNSLYLRLAAAELAMRRNELARAEMFVQQLLHVLPERAPLLFRALRLAGMIAHLSGRESDARDRYERAEDVADAPPARREARWGQFMALAACEDERSLKLLAELEASAPPDDPRERVRIAEKQLLLLLRFGQSVNLTTAKAAEKLLSLVNDPMVRSSFRSSYSLALLLAARYDDALRIAQELIEEAREANNYGVTYGYAASGLALAGLRRFSEAHAALDEALEAARSGGDTFGEQNAYAARMRLLLHEGRPMEACLIEPPALASALPSIQGEVFGVRGLALAAVGQSERALELAEKARTVSRAVESTLLSVAIHAVVDVRASADDAVESAALLLNEATARGGIDLLVTAYRAAPGLLSVLLANPGTSEAATFALTRAGDVELARSIGAPVESAFDVRAALSPREREVYWLLCEGLSDREISKRLFIAPGTTKTHTHSILEKTGFRTRRALMLDAARRRSQATPTMADDSTEPSTDR